jgi:hypothetical protein
MPNVRSKRSMATVLKRRAAAQMAQYPQYAGHFNKYVLCRVKRDVKTKMGLAFSKGEVAICKPQDWSGSSVVVWSMRNAIDTHIPSYDVQILGGKGGTQSFRGGLRRTARRR